MCSLKRSRNKWTVDILSVPPSNKLLTLDVSSFIYGNRIGSKRLHVEEEVKFFYSLPNLPCNKIFHYKFTASFTWSDGYYSSWNIVLKLNSLNTNALNATGNSGRAISGRAILSLQHVCIVCVCLYWGCLTERTKDRFEKSKIELKGFIMLIYQIGQCFESYMATALCAAKRQNLFCFFIWK